MGGTLADLRGDVELGAGGCGWGDIFPESAKQAA